VIWPRCSKQWTCFFSGSDCRLPPPRKDRKRIGTNKIDCLGFGTQTHNPHFGWNNPVTTTQLLQIARLSSKRDYFRMARDPGTIAAATVGCKDEQAGRSGKLCSPYYLLLWAFRDEFGINLAGMVVGCLSVGEFCLGNPRSLLSPALAYSGKAPLSTLTRSANGFSVH
jgi:hypothetical protein